MTGCFKAAGAGNPASRKPDDGLRVEDLVGLLVDLRLFGRGQVALVELLGGAGLGYNILNGQKQSANVQALNDQAARQNQTGAQLESYLTSGTLPAGLQGQVTQAVQSAKAAVEQAIDARQAEVRCLAL